MSGSRIWGGYCMEGVGSICCRLSWTCCISLCLAVSCFMFHSTFGHSFSILVLASRQALTAKTPSLINATTSTLVSRSTCLFCNPYPLCSLQQCLLCLSVVYFAPCGGPHDARYTLPHHRATTELILNTLELLNFLNVFSAFVSNNNICHLGIMVLIYSHLIPNSFQIANCIDHIQQNGLLV
jgi:hypothetical protein